MLESPVALNPPGPATPPRDASTAGPPSVMVFGASRRAARAARRRRTLGTFRWAYLGNDLAKGLALERVLPSTGRRVDMASAIRQAAEELRDPYIAYVGVLGARHPSPEWWLGPVSEKNQYVSTTFRHVCYLVAGRRLIAEPPADPLLLFVESPAVRRCLLRAGGGRPPAGKGGAVVRARDWAQALPRRALFLAREALRLLQCRLLLAGRRGLAGGACRPSAGGLVAILTWADGRCFGRSGEFADAYFGALARWGRHHGLPTATVPLLDPRVPYRTALRRLARAGEAFLVPHAYLRLADVFGAVRRSTLPLPRRRSLPPFRGVDIGDLLEEDEREAWVRTRGADLWLLAAMVRGWRRAGLSIDRVIYPFENHIWERALILAVREHFPAARLVGYQHARLSRFLLNYFIREDEGRLMPLPDRIVTNGAHGAALLRRSGYDPRRIVAGGALRHQYLFDRLGRPAPRASGAHRPTILVTPSIGLSEGAEAVWKALRAFGDAPQYRVRLKCHPRMPSGRIAAALGLRVLPAHFEVTAAPIPALLERCDVLVYTAATTCLEAIACGVPCIHLLPEADVDMDPLEDFPALREAVATPEELARVVGDIVGQRETYVAARRAGWEDALRHFFGEVTEGFLSALLVNGEGPGGGRG